MGNYFVELYHISMEMAPYLLFGFIVAGVLRVYVSQTQMNKFVGKSDFRSVVNAAMIGVPLPLCSCGVIPTGVSFYKQGASKGATHSFLISTPQTGVDSIMATYALMGLPFAIIRPIVAFVSGVLGGVFSNFLEKADKVPPVKPIPIAKEEVKGSKLKQLFYYAFVDFLMDIALWLVIGLLLAALIAVVLPPDFFQQFIGSQWLSYLIILAGAIPLYVCATGSIPIAAVLIAKGLSPGAALVFLMAGPATNAATITVISKAIGKKFVYIYIGTIIFTSLLFAVIIDNFLPMRWFISSVEHLGHAHFLPNWLSIGSLVILIVFLANGLYMKYIKHLLFKNKQHTMIKLIKIKVEGMSCNHCKANVERNIATVNGVGNVTADVVTGEVLIEGENVDMENVKMAVEKVGYMYKGLQH